MRRKQPGRKTYVDHAVQKSVDAHAPGARIVEPVKPFERQVRASGESATLDMRKPAEWPGLLRGLSRNTEA